MPIFEYLCKNCGTRFEIFIRNGEKESGCPQCKSTEMQRIFSPAYSNFQAWSETAKRTVQDALQWEPDIKA